MSKRSKTLTKDSPPQSPASLPRLDLSQSRCACGAPAGVTGECVECAQKKLAASGHVRDEAAHPAPSTVSDVVRAPGEPLDAETRASMESRLGHDFSRVRVHTDERAAQSASEVNALAYTIGQDVVFARGQYAPHSSKGQKLLAHELAHTTQQSETRGALGGPTPIGARDSVFEHEADLAAEGLSRGSLISMTPSAPGLQKKDPTPEELAAAALKTGPKEKKEKSEFEKAGKAAEKLEKAGTKITRVEIPAADKDEPVKPVTSSEYASEFKKCRKTKAEAGLPKAFLCTDQQLTPPDVAPDVAAKFSTNVRVAFKADDGGGSIWVVSASLPWVLNTAGFLDTSAIDPAMLKPYDTHEQGHRAIAHQVRDRLARLLQVELEGALPTAKSPLKKSGKSWDQDGVDAIIKQISGIQKRYEDWFEELTGVADAAWDAQEKAMLSKIAAAIKAKEFKPGQTVPEVKE
ncbi:MAG TPA: DUF4157 domain-containing protein [Blastocatellia bacterium]